MSNVISCPSCRRQLRVPAELLGQLVKCPSCNHTFAGALDELAPEEPPPLPAAAEEPNQAAFQLEDEEPPPKRKKPRREIVDVVEEEYEDEESPRRRREPPGQVQAIAVMTLVGGILALIIGAGWVVGSAGACCFYPGSYYSIVLGIMAVTKASQLLGKDAYKQTAPKAIAIMQIINVINFDFPNLVMGILTLVFLNDAKVRRFYRQ